MKNKILAFMLTITSPIWIIPVFLFAMLGAAFTDCYEDILKKLESK
jgi:hypothetical protein